MYVCHINGSTFTINKKPSFVSINLPLTYGSVMGMRWSKRFFPPVFGRLYETCQGDVPFMGSRLHKDNRTFPGRVPKCWKQMFLFCKIVPWFSTWKEVGQIKINRFLSTSLQFARIVSCIVIDTPVAVVGSLP